MRRPPSAEMLSLLLLLATALISSHAQTAVSAARFIDSIGINTHLHYQNTAYNDFPRVEQALLHLGVHHVRDGLVDSQWPPYYAHLNALGKDGIHALLITAPGQTSAFLSDFPKRIPGVMESFEAPNELDAGGADWPAKTVAALQEIAPAARKWNMPVVGPSFTQRSAFLQFSGKPSLFDFGNLHNYFGGRNPGTSGWGDDGYGSYDWALKLAHQAWGNKPLMTTETGYIMDPAIQDGVPENIAARYIVRLLFEQYRHGIQRTYLYELLDTDIPAQNVHDHYGLCRSDFSPKPAYVAVQSLIGLLAEPANVRQNQRSANLEFHISGAAHDVHTFLLQKQNGDFYLALWVEEPGYDVNKKQLTSVPAQQITVTLPRAMHAESLHFSDDGKLSSSTPQTGPSIKVSVDDRVTLLHLSSTTAGH